MRRDKRAVGAVGINKTVADQALHSPLHRHAAGTKALGELPTIGQPTPAGKLATHDPPTQGIRDGSLGGVGMGRCVQHPWPQGTCVKAPCFENLDRDSHYTPIVLLVNGFSCAKKIFLIISWESGQSALPQGLPRGVIGK